jgi:hypothetical protein
VAELRLDGRAAATEASAADKIRRAFHHKWESRVPAMQLPAVLRAFGIEIEVEGGGLGQKPTAGQLRKAYRYATPSTKPVDPKP